VKFMTERRVQRYVRYPYNVSAPMNDNWIPWGQDLR
jgi:hypothetical protein